MKNENKYATFLHRFCDNHMLYGMAMTFVMDNGFNAVSAMTADDFKKVMNAERNFLDGKSANAFFAVAKDIVQSVSPLMLVTLAGNGCYEQQYIRDVYGPGAKAAKAVCPGCGGNHFMVTDGAVTCCNCGATISWPGGLDIKVGEQRTESELGYLYAFADEVEEWDETYFSQLRSLWTAYCLHYGVDVDTSTYDNNLRLLWEHVDGVLPFSAEWSDFDSFGMYMCELLV